jgi:hypothetical protein
MPYSHKNMQVIIQTIACDRTMARQTTTPVSSGPGLRPEPLSRGEWGEKSLKLTSEWALLTALMHLECLRTVCMSF